MADKNIVIVGATGFIGSSLISELIKNHHNNIIAVGRIKNIFLEELEHKHSNFSFIELDIKQLPQNFVLPESIDILYYLVSGTHPAKSWNNPEIELELNLMPLINFMGYLADSKTDLKKVLFLSSGGTVYGETKMEKNGFSEECLAKPLVPYGIFKKTQEDLLRYYSKRQGFTLYNCRVGNVFGPNYSKQKDFGVINIWLSKILNGEPIQVFGSHEIVRDYIFIKDLVAMLQYPLSGTLEEGDYNISTGNHFSLKEVLEMIIQVCPMKVSVEQTFARASDADVVVLNGRKFNAKCKFASTPMLSGIEQTLTYLTNESK
ncbi:NAD-dependent epimerase/dehydratase family protein [Fulvivirgaceae bacterium LMO-SS25]